MFAQSEQWQDIYRRDEEHLREILSRREYDVRRPEPTDTEESAQVPRNILENIGSENISDNVSEKTSENIAEDFMEQLEIESSMEAASGLQLGVYINFGLLLVVFIYILYRLVRMKVMHKDTGQHVVSAEEKTLSHDDYLRKAQSIKDAAEYREGMRYAFLALLLFFDQQRVVEIRPWKTNFEYAVEMEGRRAQWAPLFRSLAGIFDRVWYGEEKIDFTEYTRFVKNIEECIHQATQKAVNERAGEESGNEKVV